MANELQLGGPTGRTIYAVIVADNGAATGQFWNTSGSPAFEAFNAAHWANYRVALAEQSTTGIYLGNLPAVGPGRFAAFFYTQAGGAAAVTDALAGPDAFDFDGTSKVPRAAVDAVLGAKVSVGTGTGQLGLAAGKVAATVAAGDVTGNLPADLQTIKTQAVTAGAGVTFPAAIGTSTYAGADTAGTTTLLARLTSTRAGYLDNLSAGAVALASQIPANFTTATFASSGVFATAALANAPTGSGSSGSVVVDSGTVSASPPPTTTSSASTFTATGANLHAPTGGYTIAPMWVLWTGNTSSGVAAANQGIKSLISAHTVTGSGSGASHAFVVGALPVAPATGDQFVVV